MNNLILGIDIGGTNIKYALATSDGDVVYKNKVSTDSFVKFEELVEYLEHNVKMFISKNQKFKLVGIGVGAPNANPKNCKIENAPNLKWGTVDVHKAFKRKSNVDIKVDNDANIAALGEHVFGQGKDCSNFMVITLGTGVGSGIVLDGKIYHGKHQIGSEAGHMYIGNEKRVCSCGKYDHLEGYLSSSGIKLSAKKILNKEMKFREIKQLFLNNDGEIEKVIDFSVDHLAQALANISAIFCPELFILSGGVSTLGERFIEKLNQKLEELNYGVFKGQSKVVLSSLSAEDGAILGAIALFNS